MELSLPASQDPGLIALQTPETKCSWCAFMTPVSHHPLTPPALRDFGPLVTSALLVEAAAVVERSHLAYVGGKPPEGLLVFS